MARLTNDKNDPTYEAEVELVTSMVRSLLNTVGPQAIAVGVNNALVDWKRYTVGRRDKPISNEWRSRMNAAMAPVIVLSKEVEIKP